MGNKLPNISMGDLAESIMNGGHTQGVPAQSSQSFNPSPFLGAMPPPSPGQIDISNVQVSEDFVTSIVEGKDSEIANDPIQEAPLKEVSKGKLLEDLLVRLCSLLEETKGLISEMGIGAGGVGNTAGSVGGVNLGGGKKKRRVRRRKRTVEQTIDSVLKGIGNGNI